MSRNPNHQEIMRVAAERMRLKKEKEELEEKEFYTRITSGGQWLLFKSIVFFCLLMAIVSTIEVFVDGPSKKITDKSWKINPDWDYTWHKVLDVEGYMFTPTIVDWSNRVDKSLKMTYSPIFHTGKKLVFDIKNDAGYVKRQEEINQHSIFVWFPAFQIFLLIPLVTYVFKRQSPWFNFGRIASLAIVFPGTLLVIFLAML